MIRTFARAFRAECRRILDAWQATDETPTAEAAIEAAQRVGYLERAEMTDDGKMYARLRRPGVRGWRRVRV